MSEPYTEPQFYECQCGGFHPDPLCVLNAEGEWVDPRTDYPACARAIALHLAEFCDETLPYPGMIAEAARRARLALNSERAAKKALAVKLAALVER